MGTESALYSSLVTHSWLPFFESNARNRRSFEAPMNINPPAVAIEPPRLTRPVSFLPSGSSSVMPSRTCHAISPVFAFTAVSKPQGGFWHGHLDSPITFPSLLTLRSQNFEFTELP